MSAPTGLAVLAGGLGLRMEDQLQGTPKAMAPISRTQSLLAMVVERASRERVPMFIITDTDSESHLRTELRPPDATWIVDEGVGTGRAVARLLDDGGLDRYVIMNCDTLVPFDIFDIVQSSASETPIRQHLTRYSSQNEGLIGLDQSGSRVVFWGESSHVPPGTGVERASSSGVYELTRDARRLFADSTVSFENEVLPEEVRMGRLEGILHLEERPTYDFGTQARYRDLLNRVSMRDRLLKDMGLLWR